jgi:hypothetical protein
MSNLDDEDRGLDERPSAPSGPPETPRLWRISGPHPPEWQEILLRLAAETAEGRMLAPAFHGNILSFNARPQGGTALRLVKDLMVQATFAVEHQGCGGVKSYVGDTRISMTCACGAEIVRRLGG